MGHHDSASLQKVEDAARRGLNQIADRFGDVRSQVARASERTVGYVQEAPVRSALVAMAAGALVYALVRAFSHSRTR